MNTETELKIRWLISQKEAAIAEANMELSRGGWTIGWNIVFREIDAEIDALINPPANVEPPKEDKPKMMRCESWNNCMTSCPKAYPHPYQDCCRTMCKDSRGIIGSKCVEVDA